MEPSARARPKTRNTKIQFHRSYTIYNISPSTHKLEEWPFEGYIPCVRDAIRAPTPPSSTYLCQKPRSEKTRSTKDDKYRGSSPETFTLIISPEARELFTLKDILL
ncbi:hypothetical protein LTR70_005733 [Exophiala xenobiotica]|uniref:Uncharacterized protein n=1 Tax=Lithohypha guttulata TaxID=1690604 RepID=A0ABR0K958_9EURO|nr:hypothetical protein LTR24_005470 [Lithohypha guttulata]KAK5317627.1 hypothetical protein LTR70_005733 [Exophiala xenobiotica]